MGTQEGAVSRDQERFLWFLCEVSELKTSRAGILSQQGRNTEPAGRDGVEEGGSGFQMREGREERQRGYRMWESEGSQRHRAGRYLEALP